MMPPEEREMFMALSFEDKVSYAQAKLAEMRKMADGRENAFEREVLHAIVDEAERTLDALIEASGKVVTAPTAVH